MTYLLIGASGLLGTNMSFHNKDVLKPCSKTLNITDSESIYSYIKDIDIDTVILSAAYTNSGNSNNQKELAYNININGVRNVISNLSPKTRLVYISSDYVFKGDKGNYKTTDVTDPVPNNYYAYTKAVAEEIVRNYKNHLIVRTSFCPTVWPYKIAFIDKYTSADVVTVIAPKIVYAIENYNNGIVHIGTERKSTYEMAFKLNPAVIPESRLIIPNHGIAYDTSLELT